jgi:hypothetical protein
MELHRRVELIDTLMEEADQKTQSLHHALHAKERAEQIQGSSHVAPLTEEEQGLQHEQALWDKAQMGLTELRKVFEELEQLERARGVSQ